MKKLSMALDATLQAVSENLKNSPSTHVTGFPRITEVGSSIGLQQNRPLAGARQEFNLSETPSSDQSALSDRHLMALRGILSQCALLTDRYGLSKNDLDGLVLAWASEVKGYTIKEVENAFYLYRQPKEAGGEGGKKFPQSVTIKEILLRERGKTLLKLESHDSIRNSRIKRCQRIIYRVLTLGFSIEEDDAAFLIEFKEELGALIPTSLQDKVNAYLNHKNTSEEERAAQRRKFAEALESGRKISEEVEHEN